MDERFLKEEGTEVFTGNELILKGALESRAALITGYPGSPVSDIFDVAYSNRDLLKRHGILAEMANNEALAVARLNGSRMAAVRAMAVMKSVGLHVAADGLALGNLSEPQNEGGSIVVVGDDPWIDSTQVNNDSRFLSQHLHMPILEPSTFQEMKDWVGIAFELSSRANLYITYLITTNQADGGGTVWVRPNQYPEVNTLRRVVLDTEKINLENTVLLPPRTWVKEATLPRRFEKLLEEVRKLGMNALTLPSPMGRGPTTTADDEGFPLGFIASGLTYCYLEHALTELGLPGRFPILKLGLTYPVDPEAVVNLAKRVDAIYVIEEKRGFVETQVIRILHDARQEGNLEKTVPVWGKNFPSGLSGISEQRGLNASIVMESLIPLLFSSYGGLTPAERERLERERILIEATALLTTPLPARTPTFCPGCPHRDSSSVLLEVKKDFSDRSYMKKNHDRDPIDLVFHGETGCFTMLMFEPNTSLMHNYSGMGLGGGTGAGLDPFVTNKQVVFLGDSTFFHSGMVAISDSIKSGQDITYNILDNKTTAMTGHQPTPGTGMNLMGEHTFSQNIEAIVRGMAGSAVSIHRVNPEYRDSYRALLEDTILEGGVKIIIADKECGITYQRRRRKEKKLTLRRQGFLSEEKTINITPEVCEFCLECTKTTGCPGLTIEETLYGPKIVTDLTNCVSDGACAKVKVCPSFEEVTIRRKGPSSPVSRLPRFDRLLDPQILELSGTWHAYTAGVGGMGAGLISAILVQAAHRQGYRVLFSDKKGLAIRNGGVYAHLLLTKTGGTLSPIIPYGKADLVLGLDLLEAARGLDPASTMRVAHPDRTQAVVNKAQQPTVLMLMGRDKSQVSACEEALRSRVKGDAYWSQDLSALSEHFFGSKLYANMLLLGAAYQLGRLPLAGTTLEWAISQSVAREDREVNLSAFRLGRLLILEPSQVKVPQRIHNFATLLEEKSVFLKELYGPKSAEAYRVLVGEAVLQLNLDDDSEKALALRAYDLICYQDLRLAKTYLSLVVATAKKDRASWNFEATKAVIFNAFKVIAIKDEVYVAHLLTSPEKRERDRLRFNVDESRGDRLDYKHINQPEIVLFGKAVRWNMRTRDWQLGVVKRLKFLRDWLPDWHRDERAFRDWYLALAERFEAESEEAYRVWVEVLRSPEEVRGFREIRRPTMEAARKKVEALLAQLTHRQSQPPLLQREAKGDFLPVGRKIPPSPPVSKGGFG